MNKYLIKHLLQLRKGRTIKVAKILGEEYLKTLFKEKYYGLIIKLQEKGTLSKKWFLGKEVQLYWKARSYIKRKNIPPLITSAIYAAEKNVIIMITLTNKLKFVPGGKK